MYKVVAIVMWILLVPGIVQAACSIGANPLNVNAKAVPGQNVKITWNLYNIHGDRITHVVVGAVNLPDGWGVAYSPELHDAAYNVSGVLHTVEENVGLEPAGVVDAVPANPPGGVDYVRHPQGDGYIPVRPVGITLAIPDDVSIGDNYKIEFEATGNCFTGAGAAVPGIATKLNVNVDIVAENFSEEAVSEVCGDGTDNDLDGLVDCEDAECWDEDICKVTPEGGGITGFIAANAPWIGLVVVLVVLLVCIGFVRKRGGRV